MKVVRLEEAPGSTLQFFTGNRGGEPIGTIAIPTRDKVSVQLFMSLMNADWSFLPEGRTIQWSVIQGSILTSQRNELVQRMKGDWILFIDADMTFDVGAIGALIQAREEHDLDMLGGLCFQRVAPHQPTLYMRETPTAGGYLFLEKWDDDIIEVDATGMAFVVIHQRVFERVIREIDHMPDFVWPSYEERVRSRPPDFFRWSGRLGEDLRFCQDAKASGNRIFVDTRVKIGHVTDEVVTETSFLRDIAEREPEIEQRRRELNDRLGLPTLSATEAKERLGW